MPSPLAFTVGTVFRLTETIGYTPINRSAVMAWIHPGLATFGYLSAELGESWVERAFERGVLVPATASELEAAGIQVQRPVHLGTITDA